MDSTVDVMASAYDALIDAAAAAVREPGRAAALENLKRCLDVFNESCDRAEDLVQAAAESLAPAPPAALCRTVQAIEQDLQDAGNKEGEEEEDKDPTPPAVVAEDK